MENLPSNSIEKQIDNFLEHFKRSASKAMDADWCSINNSSSSGSGSVGVGGTNNIATTNMSMSTTQQQQQQQQQPQHILQRTKSRSSCLDVSELDISGVKVTSPTDSINTTAMTTVHQADSDAQLFSTLCEIDKNNYLYLFERCKLFKVNARQLRYFENDHIRELIPKSNLGVLAEFQFLLNEWRWKNGFIRAQASQTMTAAAAAAMVPAATNTKPTLPKITVNMGTMTTRLCTESRSTNTDTLKLSIATLINEEESTNDLLKALRFENTSPSPSYIESPRPVIVGEVQPGDNYPLKSIIPTVLARCQQKYKANRGLLTEVERRLLSSSIIDYFISRKIHVKATMINDLAEQIVQYFPTESKRAWYERKNHKGRGRLFVKLYNSHRSKERTTKKRKINENAATEFAEEAEEEEDATQFDGEGAQIQNWLKSNKCEDITDVIQMWEDSLNYRRTHLRRIQQGSEESVGDMLEAWPAYTWPDGHYMLAIDFAHMYPQSTPAFQERWPIFKTNIVTLMEVELKDGTSVELFKQFKMAQKALNEDSSEAILIHLLHAVTKPTRIFNTPQGVRRFCITDSQNASMRLIGHASHMEKYDEEYPCIFVVGDSMLNVDECYVAYRNIRYKIKFADALAACVHIYKLFKLDCPLATMNFWRFIRGYLFDINEEDEATYAVMDNIIKYLETCGARNSLKN